MLTAAQLSDKVRGYLPDADIDSLERAYDFAMHAHKEQFRKSGEPYFVHPVSVAETLADMQLGVSSICAGLLHDVVEDTEVTVSEVEERFGTEVAALVDGLTKLSQLSFASKEDLQAESFRKMLGAMGKDVRVLLIKLSDRLDNMRTMQHMKPASQVRICNETLEIYAPLAHRLGLYEVKTELEDLSLRYIDPAAFQQIKDKLESTHRERERYIEGVSKTITQVLAEGGLACHVLGRPRHLTSIYRRMRALKCEFEQIFDLVAFEVCVDTVSDCYTALGLLHSKWTPVPGCFKDYIALRKANSYQSLHTTLVGPGRQRVEFHLRTHAMHRVALHGVVAQLTAGPVLDAERKKVAASYSWVKEMEPYQKTMRDPAEFLEMIKTGLVTDEICVFTPKGEMRSFPRGATPLDFAYSVHTELGEHCAGARVNGQEVSMRHRLRNGDHVEIIVDPKRSPSKDWLDSCATPRARSCIRTFLRAQNRHKSINLGRELLESEMHRDGMSLSKFLKSGDVLDTVLQAFEATERDELLLAVGFGKAQAHDVVEAIKAAQGARAETDTPVPSIQSGALEKLVRKVKGKNTSGIRVDGFDSVLVRFAKCCNPLPGDPIIGFMTRGRGVAVHRRGCRKAFDTTDPLRRVDVSWGSGTKIMRPVSVTVTTRNSPGILAKVSEAFSAHKINLQEANCRASDDGSAENVFTFLAADVSQLRGLMTALARVKGVVDVSRV